MWINHFNIQFFPIHNHLLQNWLGIIIINIIYIQVKNFFLIKSNNCYYVLVKMLF